VVQWNKSPPRPTPNFSLKGQCHEIFCFRFFSSITFLQAPENNIRVISNLFENSQRYSQVKAHHTPVVLVELRISPRIFEKIRNEPKGILRGLAWGKLIHEKNQKSKISWHCPFNEVLCLVLLLLVLNCVAKKHACFFLSLSAILPSRRFCKRFSCPTITCVWCTIACQHKMADFFLFPLFV